MIQELQFYPAYKSSGVDWLGDVPAHWRGSRLRYLADIATGERDTIDREDNGKYPFFVRSQTVERINTWSFDEEAVLTAGDGHVGKIFHYIDGKFDFHQRVYKFSDFRNVTGKFFFHYIKAALLFELLKGTAKTTVESIRLPMLKDFPFVIPPFSEQRAIARYLNNVDRRIQRYIEAKEQLIALLQEARQAIIQRAVTRGLEPDVPLKPTGVDWLGDVPAHWEVRRLGHMATKFGSGITPRGGATVYQEDGIPFLRSQNIHFDGLRLQNVARIASSLHQGLSGSHVKPGDVLLNITGASIGRACAVPDSFAEGNVNQHVCIIRPDQSRLLSSLLAAYLSTPMMQREIRIEQKGASREGLTLQSIRGFRVIVPPLPEQRAIAAHLDQATTTIDAAIDNAQRQTERMAEFRASLIAHVVTGKRDVRAAAAQLPADNPAETPVPEQEKMA